jgi:hypothetical protein
VISAVADGTDQLIVSTLLDELGDEVSLHAVIPNTVGEYARQLDPRGRFPATPPRRHPHSVHPPPSSSSATTRGSTVTTPPMKEPPRYGGRAPRSTSASARSRGKALAFQRRVTQIPPSAMRGG